jgi:hypothetical protein
MKLSLRFALGTSVLCGLIALPGYAARTPERVAAASSGDSVGATGAPASSKHDDPQHHKRDTVLAQSAALPLELEHYLRLHRYATGMSFLPEAAPGHAPDEARTDHEGANPRR